jgi:DNA-binding NtrC family response regulator
VSFQESVAPVTGREGELVALLREWSECRAEGRARFVFVRGPRGVGKSHLLRSFRDAVTRRGAPVLEGGHVRESQRPWALMAPLLQQGLSLLPSLGVPDADAVHLVRNLGSMTAGAPGAERQAVFSAAADLFERLGASGATFLFSDLDAADRASLELLRYVAAVASAPQGRAGGLYVLSFRDDDALPAVLNEFTSKLSARTVALRGFDLEGLKAYLQQGDVAQRLLSVTGGNPEALGSLFERPVVAVDFLARRLERLSALSRTVLEAVALVTEPVSVEVLSQVLGCPVEQTASVVDQLVVERLMSARLSEGKPRWRLAREGDREAVLAAVAPEQRRSLAEKVSTALMGSGELLAAASTARAWGTSNAGALALEGARRLFFAGALEDAAVLFADAAQRLASLPGEATLQWAQVLATRGESRRAARRYLQTARSSPALRGGALVDAAMQLAKGGRLRWAAQVLEQVTGRDVALERAEVAMLRGQASEALVAARSAVGESARHLEGRALLLLGRSEEAVACFSERLAAAEASADLHGQALSQLNLGVAAFKLGQRGKAVAMWSQVSEAFPRFRASADANLGGAAAETGDFEGAVAHLSRAMGLLLKLGNLREAAHAASNLARVYHLLGDMTRAGELAVFAATRASGHAYVVASSTLTQGAIALDRKEAVLAARLLGDARAGFERMGNDGYAALAAALKARAHLAQGERAQAGIELERQVVANGSGQLDAALLEVELTRAEWCLAASDLMGATRAANRAKDALLSSSDLEGGYRTSHVLGRIRATAGDAAGAVQEYSRAGRLLDELVQKVPPASRAGFLAVPRRAEVVAVAEPEQRAVRAAMALTPQPVVERLYGFVGHSMALQRITKQLEPIGRSSATVLVRGESGTGKEVLAEALHALSPRRHMPLVKVNCAAMVEDLLLSELFGHEKGAFTGAIKERKGRFEMADGGTIFLDEIGDISPKAQVALLRVLQEREFERVGGSKTLKVDVRVICATNRDLEKLIASGQFRADLYYRLKGVMLELPPLRTRGDDVVLLAKHFLARAAKDRGETPLRLSPEAQSLLCRHSWPGNVRELENVVASAAIFAEGSIVGLESFSHVAELRALMPDGPTPDSSATAVMAESDDFDVSSPGAPPVAQPGKPIDFYELARQSGLSLRDLRHQIEMQCIKRALVEANGNISEAARLLMMKRSRLSQIVNAEADLREVAHGS